jgi:hypothetical protein
MNVFQLVKTVLDELYIRIPAETEAEKDEKILQMMRFLEAEYPKLIQGVRIDYSDLVTRFAYIYKYVTSHANLVYQVINASTDLANLFDNEKVNVACIGGGPGSDFLGILKFLTHAGKSLFLRCILFDKEQAWAECWNDVDEKLEAQLRISTFFQPFDVTNESTWSDQSKYLKSDLFSMVYFMSEIDALRKGAEPFFSNLFEKAKSGALFLYIDNNNPQFYGWFDSLAATHGLSVIQSDELKMHIEDWSEDKTDLGVYWEKFEHPKLRANVAFRVCRKE